MSYARLLIVEDDHSQQQVLSKFLVHHEFRCHCADSIATAKCLLGNYNFDAVLLDLNLGDDNGLELVPFIAKEYPFTKIFILSSIGTIDVAVDAMEKGATSFFPKSTSPGVIVSRIKKKIGLRAMKSLPSENDFTKFGIIGDSAPMKQLYSLIDQLKDIDSTIIIEGESGTGKELVARSLHAISKRAGCRFEAINCGAIPENLLESELFGYKKGAFTDAKTDKKGVFEVCSDGTLFLDEICELPMALQVKLLRVLQEKELKPLGATKAIKINTRIIAASNKILENQVSSGNFREDLYFRVSVFKIRIPPLRERAEDIPLITDYLVKKFNKLYGRKVNLPSKRTIAELQSLHWAGNIRELQNKIESAVVLSTDDELRVENDEMLMTNSDSQGDEPMNSRDIATFSSAKLLFEKTYLRSILSKTKGNISEASHIAGRFRSDIYRLMAKHDMSAEEFKVSH